MTPTPYQRQNLAELARLLPTVDPARFGMRDFFYNRETVRDLSPRDKHTCNTSACAVGWAPALGIGKLERGEGFRTYSCRELCPAGDVWVWLFEADWSFLPEADTPTATANRIAHYLANGLPGDWVDQMLGEAPLCFEVGEVGL